MQLLHSNIAEPATEPLIPHGEYQVLLDRMNGHRMRWLRSLVQGLVDEFYFACVVCPEEGLLELPADVGERFTCPSCGAVYVRLTSPGGNARLECVVRPVFVTADAAS